LSHHLRHFNLSMTIQYVTGAAAGMILEEEEVFTRAILKETAQGERRLSGPFGDRFGRMLERAKQDMRKNVNIVLSERLGRWVDQFLSNSRVVLKANPWGYCVCPPTREGALHANCRKRSGPGSQSGSGPDLAEASPDVCATCYFSATDDSFMPVVKREVEAIRRRLSNESLPPLARAAELKRLEVLEKQLASQGGQPASVA
jgi:hypothetical protein